MRHPKAAIVLVLIGLYGLLVLLGAVKVLPTGVVMRWALWMAVGAMGLGLHVLWQSSTLRRSPLAWQLPIGVVIGMVAFVLYTLRWPFAKEGMAFALVWSAGVYAIHCWRKVEKGIGDVLRLLFVLGTDLMIAGWLWRWLSMRTAFLVVLGLLAATMVLVMRGNNAQQTAER